MCGEGFFLLRMKDLFDLTPLWYKLILLFCVILTVASFLVPPVGVIDPSVIGAIGELGGFSLLGMLPSLLGKAKTVKVEKGNTSIEIETKHKEIKDN